MKLATAQISSVAGNFELNLEKHIRLTELAVANGISALFFPELSLTGYEPRLAEKLAIQPDDSRLNLLDNLSHRHDILIAVGAPAQDTAGVKISMITFQSGMPRRLYAKQHLHPDELSFFSAGTEDQLFHIAGHVLAPAICYESLQVSHALKAAKAGAKYYLASVAKSHSGVSAAYNHYPLIAKQFGMTVLMANSIGPSDGFLSAGKSGVWNSDGKLVISAGSFEEVLVVHDTDTGKCQLIST